MLVLLIASFIIGWLVGAKQEQKRMIRNENETENNQPTPH